MSKTSDVRKGSDTYTLAECVDDYKHKQGARVDARCRTYVRMLRELWDAWGAGADIDVGLMYRIFGTTDTLAMQQQLAAAEALMGVER